MVLQLPPELLSEILAYALDVHPRPGDILCVHSQWLALGVHIVYTRLHFRSVRQLSLFSKGTTQLPCATRALHLTLSGGSADFEVFRYLRDAIERLCHRAAEATGLNPTRLNLELLSLRLHSHTSNPNLRHVYDALVVVK